MRVFRGPHDSAVADAAVTGHLQRLAADGERAVRVWRPHRQVAFGPRDVRADGYADAAAAARERGYEPTTRRVGGRAVAHTGATLAFALAEPVADPRLGIHERYDGILRAVQRTCRRRGVAAHRAEPAGAFCPGQHSLSADGKLAGVAQRVTADAALVAGVVVLDGPDAVGEVLAPVYDALDVPFDPGAVGSVATAGGRPDGFERTLETALVGDADPRVEPVPKDVDDRPGE